MSRPLTFQERNGLVQPPTQLRSDELTTEIRSKLWAIVYDWLIENSTWSQAGNLLSSKQAAHPFLKDWHVMGLHLPADEFSKRLPNHSVRLKETFYDPNFYPLFDFLEFTLAHREFAAGRKAKIAKSFEECLSAWRVKGNHIVPVGSEEEATTVAAALTEIDTQGTPGTKAHLRKAAEQLSKGQWADSVRESVSAVEAAARAFDQKKTLGEIVGSLAKKGVPIHPALAKSMGALYGYTSDQPGLRHSLTVFGEAAVDEHEALLIYGASVSFSQYLIRLKAAS